MSEQDDKKSGKTVAKNMAKAFVGVDDWKKSKIGYLTGYSVFRRSFGSLGNSVGTSLSNIGSMTKSVFKSENVPGLNDLSADPDEKFQRSMELHGVTDDDIKKMLKNTYKTTVLYFFLFVFATTTGVVSLITTGFVGIPGLLTKFTLSFIVLAFLIKNSYTNWMIRNKSLDGLMKYIKSLEYVPRAE